MSNGTNFVDRLIVGCGYLGRRVALKWLEQGLSVAVTTRSAKKAREFEKLGLHPIVCDVLHRYSLEHLPESNVVLHSVAVDRQSGQSMHSLYVDGTANLLDVIQQRANRIFYISSTSVYGQSAGEIVNEKSPCNPTRENAQICLEAEGHIRASGINSIIFRLSGIYGPNRLLARMNQIRQALPIPGNPDAWLNLIHIEDAVSAIIAAGDSNLSDEIILVSDDRPIRRREYYSLLADLLQAPPPRFNATQKDPKGERGEGKRCDNSKLHQLLLDTLGYPDITVGLPHAIEMGHRN